MKHGLSHLPLNARWWTVLSLVILTAQALLINGCGGSRSGVDAQSEEGLMPEAVAVRNAFAEADASLRMPVERSLKLVQKEPVTARAYTDALPSLQTLVVAPGLTAEQKQALEALIQKLQSLKSAGKVR